MNENKTKGASVHARRAVAYIVLILLTFLCLIWFYILFINATRSHAELTKGFTPIPSTHLLDNWRSLLAGTLPVWNGMLNSLLIAVLSAVLCVYFSTMTAYAIHAYDFKFKRAIFTFILAIMMIPTQVTALGFLQLIGKMKLDDSFIPLIVPSIAAPVSFFYMKQYMESVLSLSLIEAARIDGANKMQQVRYVTFPGMAPTLIIMLILKMGQLLTIGYEKVYLLQGYTLDYTKAVAEEGSTAFADPGSYDIVVVAKSGNKATFLKGTC